MYVIFENHKWNIYSQYNRKLIASCVKPEAYVHLLSLLKDIDPANDGPEVDIIRRELAYAE